MELFRESKIELHCHLDGSLDVDTTLGILKNDPGLDLENLVGGVTGKALFWDYREKFPYKPEYSNLKELIADLSADELKTYLTVGEGCRDLMEYLTRFDLPLAVLQTEYALEQSAYGFAMAAARENIRYIEARFAPTSHRQLGLEFNQIIDAVLRGLKRAKADTGIITNVIVCAMRGLSAEENLEMFKAAREYLNLGVCAADLAGNEAAYPANEFLTLFSEVKKLGMPFTLHAGECGSLINVKDSIEMGAGRIGHGVAAGKSEEVMKLAKKSGVGFELCPSSNLQTKAVESLDNYPVETFFEQQIFYNINTDNKTVSGITLTGEMELIQGQFGFDEDFWTTNYLNGVHMAFASDDVKERLVRGV